MEMAELEHGRVALAATTLNRLSALLGDFLSLHPNVQFRIKSPTESSKIQLLESGEIDFCLGNHPFTAIILC